MSESVNARRRDRALELHRQGFTYREIAAADDVTGGRRATLFGSPSTAHDAVRRAQRIEREGVPWHAYSDAVDNREHQLAALREALRALVRELDTGGMTTVKAAEGIARVTERMGALLGTDHSDGLDRAVEWALTRSAATATSAAATPTALALAERYATPAPTPEHDAEQAPPRSGPGPRPALTIAPAHDRDASPPRARAHASARANNPEDPVS